MTTDSPSGTRPETREDRLAAKLRENLRRRKSQARSRHNDDAPPLSKEQPKS